MDLDSNLDGYYKMSEVVPGLWLGSLENAQDTESLKQKNIHSILTVMRGTVNIKEVRLLFSVSCV